MTLKEAQKYLISSLLHLYSADEAKSVANIVLRQVTDYNQVQVLLYADELLSDLQRSRIECYLTELMQGVPVQYVIGIAFFAGLNFEVNPNVLIPRPETEELLDILVRDVGRLNSPVLLDLGTGSGCIAISLKKKIPRAQVFALDVSNKALQVAKSNAQNHETHVCFIHADMLLEDLPNNIPLLDVIVSNPPYVTRQEQMSMHRNVLDHEPHLALFTPKESPLLFYESILRHAKRLLKPQGKIYLEINQYLGEETKELFLMAGFRNITLLNDFKNNQRFLVVAY